MSTREEKCEYCGCSQESTICYYDCGCHKSKNIKISSTDLKIKEVKCEYCGCRGGSTLCYYNCGCHKPKDDPILPKKT